MTVYLLAGGGTAGHVNPMIAIADALRERDSSCTIIMLGTAEGLESRLIPAAGYELLTIPKLPFPRRPNKAAMTFPARWRRAVRRVRNIVQENHVDVVIGVGGYASAPAYAAARAETIPLVIHEANAKPGLANRLGARWTRFVGVAIPGTPMKHARLVGMPLRAEFERPLSRSDVVGLRASFGLDATKPTVVVTGGSLGARRINDTVVEAAPAFSRAGIQILHITGVQPNPIASTGPQHVVVEYCDRMRDALACADLVISRAGSATVCEVAALGVPAIFVPYPVGNGEQRFNAFPLANVGAAVIVADEDFTSAWAVANIPPLMADDERRTRMADAARALGIRDGRERMLRLIDDACAEENSADD